MQGVMCPIRRIVLLATIMAGVVAHRVEGQVTTGTLDGKVLLERERPAVGVHVVIEGTALFQRRSARSDSRGQFRVFAPPVGEYVVVIRLPGYRAVRYESVQVGLGQTTSLPSTMLEPGEVSLAPIVVAADRAPIDVTTAAAGVALTSSALRALPQERDVSSILALMPHHSVSPYGDGINVAGSSGYENAHFVDGAHVTDPLLGRGTAAIPYNFVREIQVRTGGYEAEFGRSLGGIVDILTHSGTNEFRVETFGFLTNNRFSGERRVGAVERAVTSFSQFDAGLTVGGPIQRDRTWFFLAYNPTVSRERIRVPSFEPQFDERRQHLFAGKVTWQPSAASTVLLTVHGDPSRHDRVGVGNEFIGTPTALASLDPILGQVQQGGITAALSAAHNAGRGLGLHARLQRGTWRNRNAGRRGGEVLVVNPISGHWSGGYGITIDETMRRTSGAIDATLDRTNHVLKAGVEVQENVLDEFFAYGSPSGTGGYRFATAPDTYTLITGGMVGRVNVRSATGFLQDSWTVRNGLRLNAGMRWDGQFFSNAADETVQRITNGWQPRFGAVFDPGGKGEEKWVVSAGRFYQQIGLALASYQFAGTHQLITNHSGASVDTATFLDGEQIPGEMKLRGEHFDEFTAGYQRVVRVGVRIGARIVSRLLREVVEDALVRADSAMIGNPGRGSLSFLPRPRRAYTALELTVDRSGRGPLAVAASYVLSRNHGNYTGVFDMDNGADLAANFGPQYDDSLQLQNASGLLPNDRTHALKIYGAWRPRSPVSVGGTMVWQSGTPLTEYATHPSLPGRAIFLSPRGTAGRTPSLLAINLRFTWAPVRTIGPETRLILDLFQVASRRSATLVDQVRSIGGVNNPNYGNPVQYQAPMAMRVGVTIGG
jgi:hypothetical protein